MSPPKNSVFFKILNAFFFLSILFLISCSINREKHSFSNHFYIAKEDRVWLEKFFRDFFLNEPTIYTLFGSKPMSEISLCIASKEEWIDNYSNLLKDFPQEKQKELLSDLNDYVNNYDLHINWDKWVEWSNKNLASYFLFMKRKTEYDKLFSIYILNVQEAAWILQKHYDVIKNEIGLDFDPLQVVLEFNDTNSVFWDKVFSSHFLQGILHGYGERNAYFFNREIKLQEKNDFDLKTHPLFTSTGIEPQEKGRNTFPLPLFRSYSANAQEDPVLLKYKKEKSKIEKILKEKNLTVTILRQLGYQSTASKKEITFTNAIQYIE